jgi:hypothetical protein
MNIRFRIGFSWQKSQEKTGTKQIALKQTKNYDTSGISQRILMHGLTVLQSLHKSKTTTSCTIQPPGQTAKFSVIKTLAKVPYIEYII